MIALLAPSKTLDFNTDKTQIINTELKKPLFPEKTEELVRFMRSKNAHTLMKLMKINQKIAEENVKRYADFSFGADADRQKPAITAFTGETYKGLDAGSFTKKNMKEAEQDLRILSGLYGILSPLTLIEPYRCEMGLKIKLKKDIKISRFWKKSVTHELNRLLKIKNTNRIVDLASAEYMAAVDKKELHGSVLDIQFKEKKEGRLKSIAVYSKQGRGMMARYIVKEKITEPESLKDFNQAGYSFNHEQSDDNCYVFVRSS